MPGDLTDLLVLGRPVSDLRLTRHISYLQVYFLVFSIQNQPLTQNCRRMSFSSQRLQLLVLLISLSGFSLATPQVEEWCCSQGLRCCIGKA
ncbi:hypothetical protein MJO28_015277 [Puccinia striiformis f. sp. tritici]|uniref:Uncharacterized protein n=1 Tax=Puccinia striiformis f. sp. tritici TaxID=168172 RepID=A0ACC0DSF9_9BASI|nr:hypothetical protein MJO28_015277 [Puccinia striiformis f. sp. tritici]